MKISGLRWLQVQKRHIYPRGAAEIDTKRKLDKDTVPPHNNKSK